MYSFKIYNYPLISFSSCINNDFEEQTLTNFSGFIINIQYNFLWASPHLRGYIQINLLGILFSEWYTLTSYFHQTWLWGNKFQSYEFIKGVCVVKFIGCVSTESSLDLIGFLEIWFISFYLKKPSLNQLFSIYIHTMYPSSLYTACTSSHTNVNIS